MVSARDPYCLILGFLDRSLRSISTLSSYLHLDFTSNLFDSGFTTKIFMHLDLEPQFDRHCGLVVRVPGYRSVGPGSIPGTTIKKSSGSGTESTKPREYELRSYLIEK
jgi:hypothetical protein